MSRALRVMLAVNDATLRADLRSRLSGLSSTQPVRVVAEVADGVSAMEAMRDQPVEVLMVSLVLPRMGGVELARHLAGREGRPAVVFVVPRGGVEGGVEVDALLEKDLDVLAYPATREALLASLAQARKLPASAEGDLKALQSGPRRYLSCLERGKIRLIAVENISYLRAELKYVTAHTPERDYLLDASLTQLEQEFYPRFLRVHRNCLVAKEWIAGFERAKDTQGEPHWWVKLAGSNEKLPVSRRQWPLVRGSGGLIRAEARAGPVWRATG